MRRGAKKNQNRRQKGKPKIKYPPVEETMEEDAKSGPPVFKALSGDGLIEYWKSNPLLKTVTAETPISNRLVTVDGSIKNRNREDEAFLRNQELQERLRRGNTMIRVLDSKGNIKKHVIGRRGLPKFYDLRAAHIEILNGKGTFKKYINSKTKLLYHEWRTIIPRAEKALKEEKELTVYLSEKANGENAQVSYVSAKQIGDKEIEEGFFVVCSKNVGITFRNVDDIDWYRGQRFSYAQQISRTWLKQFYELDEETQDEVKEFLSNHTFIGEYCGNKKLQHLVHYDKEQIIFYAVVKKLSSLPCLPYHKGSSIIEGFGLPCVSLDPYPEISTYEELGQVIEKLSKKVAKAPVEEMGEGSVLYIESRDEKSGEREVLGICKLKTLDYRFWRKLREKLKNYLNDRYDKKNLLKKFKSECLDLAGQGNYETCYEIDFYLGIAAKAVDIIRMCHVTGEHLRTVYLDFLDLVRKCFDEERLPNQEETDYFKYLSLEMQKGSDIVVPVKKQKKEKKKEKKKKKAKFVKKVSFIMGDDDDFGMEEVKTTGKKEVKAETLQKPTIGANVILAFPPGFIDIEKLEKYAGELDFNISYEYKENTEEDNYLIICLPSQTEEILKSTLKKNDYLLTLTADGETLGFVCESESKNILELQNSENIYLKSFFDLIEEETVTDEGVTVQIHNEAEIMEKLIKEQKGVYKIKKYSKLKAANEEEFNYSFNYGKMDQVLVQLLKDHRVNYSTNVKKGNSIIAVKHGEYLKTSKHLDPAKLNSKNEIFYIVFYGLSCIGKTYFFDYFQKKCLENSINSIIVSSDECADRAIKIYQEKNPDASYDEAFQKTRKLTNKIFDEEILNFTKNLNPGKTMILLDKVMHGKRFLSSIQKNFPTPTHEVKIFALYPQDYEQFKISQRLSIPFSASLILNLCHRTISREDHLTVSGTEIDKIHLTLSFCLLYRNIQNMENAKRRDATFESFHEVSFHPFVEEEKLPEEYVEVLRNVMKKIKAFNDGKEDCQEIVDILKDEEKFSELEEFLGFGDAEQWDKVISKIFDTYED